MKKFGRVLLTIYLTLTTLAAAFFGYFYFRGSNSSGGNTISTSSFDSIVTKIGDDLKTMLNKVGIQSSNATFSFVNGNNKYLVGIKKLQAAAEDSTNPYGLDDSLYDDLTESYQISNAANIFDTSIQILQAVSDDVKGQDEVKNKVYSFTLTDASGLNRPAKATVSLNSKKLIVYQKYEWDVTNDNSRNYGNGYMITEFELNDDLSDYSVCTLYARSKQYSERNGSKSSYAAADYVKLFKNVSGIYHMTHCIAELSGETWGIEDIPVEKYVVGQNNYISLVQTFETTNATATLISQKTGSLQNLSRAKTADSIVEKTFDK